MLRNRYIVLELCAGTLKDVCDKKYEGPALPPDATVLYDIGCGLTYIHSMNFVHRDIKPANILISSTNPVVIKISDFGLSKPTSDRGTHTNSSGFRGTYNWAAPECLPPENSMENTNTEMIRGTNKSDIFSAGCVFFYYVTRGIHPFGDLWGYDIVGNIEKINPVNLASECRTNTLCFHSTFMLHCISAFQCQFSYSKCITLPITNANT